MFNRSSFSPVSFSRISFNGAREVNEGRSGYYRLFFTQLQEESLRKDREKGLPARIETVAKASPSKAKVPAKKKLPPTAPLQEERLPPFKLKPIIRQQEPEVQYLNHLQIISTHTLYLLGQVYPIAAILQAGKAANDIEDHNRRVLLLAA